MMKISKPFRFCIGKQASGTKMSSGAFSLLKNKRYMLINPGKTAAGIVPGGRKDRRRF